MRPLFTISLFGLIIISRENLFVIFRLTYVFVLGMLGALVSEYLVILQFTLYRLLMGDKGGVFFLQLYSLNL